LAKDGTTQEAPVEIATVKGVTLFDAARNVIQELDRKSFYAHTNVIVISEEIAREGVLPVLDFFSRGREVRGYVWLCVAKNAQAKELLGIKSGIKQYSSGFFEKFD
jgi:spore germination protein KC